MIYYNRGLFWCYLGSIKPAIILAEKENYNTIQYAT